MLGSNSHQTSENLTFLTIFLAVGLPAISLYVDGYLDLTNNWKTWRVDGIGQVNSLSLYKRSITQPLVEASKLILRTDYFLNPKRFDLLSGSCHILCKISGFELPNFQWKLREVSLCFDTSKARQRGRGVLLAFQGIMSTATSTSLSLCMGPAELLFMYARKSDRSSKVDNWHSK